MGYQGPPPLDYEVKEEPTKLDKVKKGVKWVGKHKKTIASVVSVLVLLKKKFKKNNKKK